MVSGGTGTGTGTLHYLNFATIEGGNAQNLRPSLLFHSFCFSSYISARA